jgi:murein peptide amidase A
MISGFPGRTSTWLSAALSITLATILLAGCEAGSSEEPENGLVIAPTIAARNRLTSQGIQVENIGQSVQGRQIEALTVGRGERTAVVIGGIHTGAESETVDLVTSLLWELVANPRAIPSGTRLVFIPNVNPDGYANESRTNANGVDLNRNFPGEDWTEFAMHGELEVYGGEAALSEPETEALYNFLTRLEPDFVLSFHGYAGVIQHNNASGAESLGMAFGEAAGYETLDEWPFYEVTGELIEALGDLGIPAADVELLQSDEQSFDRALEGLQAVLRELE